MKTRKMPWFEFAPDTYEIDEFDCASIFLFVGTERALLLDTGIGIGDLKGLVEEITDKPYDVVLTHGHRDHVHIMFRAHPKSELSKFINAYKSASSRLIKKEYPEIRQKLWKEMFWSQSFCLLSAGGAPIEVIRQYIETQGENKSEHRVPFSDLPE